MTLSRRAVAMIAALIAFGAIGAGTATAAPLSPGASVTHSSFVDKPEPGDTPDWPISVSDHSRRDRIQDRRIQERSEPHNTHHHRGMPGRSDNRAAQDGRSSNQGR